MRVPEHPVGRALLRWRRLNRVKQTHAAEIFGVTQSTLSRWESGALEMTRAQRSRAESLLAARLTSAGDAALARLVHQHEHGAHLMCDTTFRLLALSVQRRREFGSWAEKLIGRSLWPYVTEELAKAEAELGDHGWFELAPPPELVLATGSNGSEIVPIRSGSCRWTRLLLSDGTAVRLVETLA